MTLVEYDALWPLLADSEGLLLRHAGKKGADGQFGGAEAPVGGVIGFGTARVQSGHTQVFNRKLRETPGKSQGVTYRLS